MGKLFNRKKEKCKIELNNTYTVKGWSNCFLAPLITIVRDLQVHDHNGHYIEALISHIKCEKSSAVKAFVTTHMIDQYNIANKYHQFSDYPAFGYLIVVSDKFTKLPRKQKLVLLLLEAARAEGVDLTNNVGELNDASDDSISEQIEAIIKVTDLFGKMTVKKAIGKARKTIDNSCYKASSHKFFQRAPKEAYSSNNTDTTSMDTKADSNDNDSDNKENNAQPQSKKQTKNNQKTQSDEQLYDEILKDATGKAGA